MRREATVWWWGNIMFLGFLALLLAALLALSACGSMRAGLDRVTEPLTENGSRAALSVGSGIAAFFLIPGGELLRVGLATLTTFIVQAMTTDPIVVAQAAPAQAIPWYLDPWAYLRAALDWLIVAVAVGLLWKRSRKQTLHALKELVTGHPILAGRRFLAGLGFLHSDPVPDKSMK